MNYSYVTLLLDDSYIFGIILLNQSLKDVKSKYPLEVLVSSKVTPPIINILEQLQLKYQIIDPIVNEEILKYNSSISHYFGKIWSDTLTKFQIFSLSYDKVIYLDADILVLKNLDHLFNCEHMTAAVDGEYFNVWKDDVHLNAGLLVIEPSAQEYQNLMEFSKDAITKWNKKECIADQEILNLYYSDWPNKPELHLNKYYNVFGPYIQDDQVEDIKENAYFIHFIGRKPWRAFSKPSNETYSEYFYQYAQNFIQDLVNKLDWRTAISKIKLAIYGICKDEMVNVEKFIKCFTKADYVCLLDTGSTDGTWEYLQEAQKTYPNLIIEQKIIDPWRYDEARNYSLTLVPNDTTIYFMMDLDEIIKEDTWVDDIKLKWNPLFSRGVYVYNRRVDEKTNTVIQKFMEYRIHNRHWHYKGIVHEQLCDIMGDRDFFSDECIECPITVWHYPTNPNRVTYVKLCERGVEENPNNWIMHLQLAAEYEIHEMYEKAIEEYKKIIIEQDTLSAPELGRCYASLGRILGILNKNETALQVLKKGQKLVPNCGDVYFLAGEIAYKTKDYQYAYNVCKEGLQNAGMNQWCTIVARENYYPYYIMGLSAYYLGNKVEGLGYISIAREKNNCEDINNVYIELINDITQGR